MKNKIYEKRTELGLSQCKLAMKAGLSAYTVVQRYEKEERTPPVDIAIRLARALNTTVEELFILDEE